MVFVDYTSSFIIFFPFFVQLVCGESVNRCFFVYDLYKPIKTKKKYVQLRILLYPQIYNFYYDNLKQTENFKIFDFKSKELALWTDIYCDKRDKLFNYLLEKKIVCRKFWLPLSFSKNHIKKNSLKISCSIYKKLLWLPSALEMDTKQLKRITKEINLFNKKYN